jgi:ornithine decarboxylase
MEGPFPLPADAREGDWIEIGQLGAYGAALRTAFNGFDRARLVDVCDPPLLATPGYGLPHLPE